MSEHHKEPRPHDPHATHEEHEKGPSDPHEINPKISSDVHYWSKQLNVTGEALHEAIRVHGTKVDKIRAALAAHHTA